MPQSAEIGTLYPDRLDRLATGEEELLIPQTLPFPIEVGDRQIALQIHSEINQRNPFVIHSLEKHEVSGVKKLLSRGWREIEGAEDKAREAVETLTGLPPVLIGNLREAFVDRKMRQLIVPVSLPDLRGIQRGLNELAERLEFSKKAQDNSDNSKRAYFNFGRFGEKAALGGAAALAALTVAPAVPAFVQEVKETLGRVNLPEGYKEATKVVVDPLGRVMVELETAAAEYTVYAQEPEATLPLSYTVKISPDGLYGMIIPYSEQEGAVPLDGKDITIEATKPYTFFVRAYYGSSAELNFGVEETKNIIQQEIALNQQIFDNSGAGNIHLVLEDIRSADYTSSGKLSEDHLRIIRLNDGHMDQIPIDRWEDEIHMIGYYDYYEQGGGCGWASLFSRFDVDFYPFEYYAVNINGAVCSKKVTPEEIGHLFGLGESYQHGLFNDSLPYIDPGHGFMTYISTGVNCILCERREYYSNPNVTTPEGWPVGDIDHNNARAIQFTAPIKDDYFKQVIIFLPIIKRG